MRDMDRYGSYSGWQGREPWELSPAQVRQERRSCRKVDEIGNSKTEHCRVIEQEKAERAAADARRTEEQARKRAQQIARRDAVHQAAMEAVRSSTPEQPVAVAKPVQKAPASQGQKALVPPARKPPAPGAAGAAPLRGGSRKRRGKGNWVWLIVAFAILFGVMGGILDSDLEDDQTEGNYSAGNDDDGFFHYFGGDESFWNEEADGEEETYTLPLYEGDSTGLVLELQSSSGKRALSYQELYEKCRPSMVSITVMAGQSGATGSGIVLTEDGYILTCHHVIEDSERCIVLTWDDQSYEAELVGSDAQTDLAVLKIPAEGLTPAELGNSDELRVGDEALAIGDPLGESFRATLTNGIISGINRSVSSKGYAMTLLQTTAAVNSGNSGGGLFNIYGQAVGVVNLKMVNGSSEATVEGMGMAVPTVTVKSVVEMLAAEGLVRRPVLGISCSSIDEITASMTGMPVGLLVQSIDEGSDCAAQGLQLYDIITEVNGVPLCTVQEFKELTASYSIGDTVCLTVYRDNNLELEEEPAEDEDTPVYEEYDYQYYGEIEVKLVDSSVVN